MHFAGLCFSSTSSVSQPLKKEKERSSLALCDFLIPYKICVYGGEINIFHFFFLLFI